MFKSRKVKVVVSPRLIFWKTKNQQSSLLVNIPLKTYRVVIENKDTDGLSEDWKLSKYDNGVTTETEFTGELGTPSKNILMSIGDYELHRYFIDSLGNQRI